MTKYRVHFYFADMAEHWFEVEAAGWIGALSMGGRRLSNLAHRFPDEAVKVTISVVV